MSCVATNHVLFLYLFLCCSLKLRFNRREFEDWIWDVCPLSEVQVAPSSCQNATRCTETAAVALSHNSVLHWNYQTDNILQVVHCEEKCILYPFGCPPGHLGSGTRAMIISVSITE